MSRAFFYDTWAFVALVNQKDAGHSAAESVDRSLERAGFSPVTTDYVIDETITLLQSGEGAHVSLPFIEALRARVAAADILLVEIGTRRREHAFEVFQRLAPSEPRLSFTDATSFVVMGELGIELAFTADRHFHRAGGGIAPLLEKRGKKLIARDLSGM